MGGWMCGKLNLRMILTSAKVEVGVEDGVEVEAELGNMRILKNQSKSLSCKTCIL